MSDAVVVTDGFRPREFPDLDPNALFDEMDAAVVAAGLRPYADADLARAACDEDECGAGMAPLEE